MCFVKQVPLRSLDRWAAKELDNPESSTHVFEEESNYITMNQVIVLRKIVILVLEKEKAAIIDHCK